MPFPFIPFAYAFTFPFGPVFTQVTGTDPIKTTATAPLRMLRNIQQPSRTWQLSNLDGLFDIRPNEMDIIMSAGRAIEITTPVQILDQRIRKSVAEVQGQNRFAPGWGSVITQYIGAKIIDTSTLRDIGQSVADMFEELIQLQSDAQARLNLRPAELIESLSRVSVTAEGTTITVHVRVITQAHTVEEILIPAAVDVVQAGGPGGTPAFV